MIMYWLNNTQQSQFNCLFQGLKAYQFARFLSSELKHGGAVTQACTQVKNARIAYKHIHKPVHWHMRNMLHPRNSGTGTGSLSGERMQGGSNRHDKGLIAACKSLYQSPTEASHGIRWGSSWWAPVYQIAAWMLALVHAAFMNLMFGHNYKRTYRCMHGCTYLQKCVRA